MSELVVLSDNKNLNDKKVKIKSVSSSPKIFITRNSILDLKARSKKHALQEASNIAEKEYNLNSKKCIETLIEREKLGSTGLGNGIAIPHGKFLDLDEIYAIFIRLSDPINFESVDGMPVDLIFTLLAPVDQNSNHLKALSQITRYFGAEEVRKNIRGADNIDALAAILMEAL